MAKLSDIELERVDGVDEPATRQRFLILKAEEPDELRQNVRELLGKVEAALNALAKAEDLILPDDAVRALNDVAKALDLDITFKTGKGKKEEGDEEEYGYPPPKSAKKDDRIYEPDALAKAIAAALGEYLEPVAALSKAVQGDGRTKPASRQAQGQDVVSKSGRKLGEGLFADIIFGG